MKKIILMMFIFSAMLFSQENDLSRTDRVKSSLLQPISVSIGGNFIVTGSFLSTSTQRLDQFITQIFIEAQRNAIGAVNKPEIVKQIKKELDEYPLRGIVIKRMNGSQKVVDLLKFRLTGDFNNNPYLMNDDVIVFPSYDIERNFVEINGAVNKPVKFQFVDGDKLSDALLFAGGINLSYDNVTEAEISRLNDDGKSEEILKVKLNEEFLLKRGDRITVMFTENNKKSFKVLVLGEVNRPGYSFITKDNTTIKDLMKRIGGFSKNADLKKAEIIRGTDEAQMLRMKSFRKLYETDSTQTTLPLALKTIDELKSEELQMMRTSNVTVDEFTRSFALDNYLRFIKNNMVIDFEKIFSDSTDDGNYILKDGDIIIVPSIQNIVYVFGQVVNPGYYNYIPMQDWKYYIQKAGGTTEQAKSESDIQIIKGKNKTWFDTEIAKNIEPGDFVYVPKEIPKSFGDTLQQIGAISSIVATAVTLVYIIIQSSK